jgi:hypothetical protein
MSHEQKGTIYMLVEEIEHMRGAVKSAPGKSFK